MKNLKDFALFNKMNEAAPALTQEEFKELHDKFYAEGTKKAKAKKNTQEFKDYREIQDNNEAAFHNMAVDYMLIKMGEIFHVKRPAEISDNEYAHLVEEDPEFDKFFEDYVKNIKSRK